MFTKVKSIIDAWHMFKSSYDETSNLLIVWYAKKSIQKILGENDKNIKLRKNMGGSSGLGSFHCIDSKSKILQDTFLNYEVIHGRVFFSPLLVHHRKPNSWSNPKNKNT